MSNQNIGLGNNSKDILLRHMNNKHAKMNIFKSNIHQTNATSQVNSKFLHGKVELIQRSLNVGYS